AQDHWFVRCPESDAKTAWSPQSPSSYCTPHTDWLADRSKSELDRHLNSCIYIYIMRFVFEPSSPKALFDLPCACQNLRRATRIVTRIYDQELKNTGLEVTQLGLLMALAAAGELNQKRLSEGFAMDSTTLTRTLERMYTRGWISMTQGADKRQRL